MKFMSNETRSLSDVRIIWNLRCIT